MTDLRESIINSIKDLLLPEIKKLQDGQNGLLIRQDAVEKQLIMINENTINNTKRIDEINKRIDSLYKEFNNRFDDMSKRVDGLYMEFNNRFDGVNNRFDEVNRKFDDVTKRFETQLDRLNGRVDYIHVEFSNVRKEMERLKRDEAVTADILHRVEILEEKTLLGR